MRKVLLVLFLLIAVASNTAAQSTRAPTKGAQKTARKSAVAKPPVSAKGSIASRRWQNFEADKEDLSRLEDRREVERFVKAGLLVPFPRGIVTKIPAWRRFVRPETRAFLVEARQLVRKWCWLPVSSAVRPKSLGRVNGNAAPTTGPLASSHPTGATVDIPKNRLPAKARNSLRNWLLGLEKQRLIEFTEEDRQPTFHVMVFRTFLEREAAALKTKAATKAKPTAKKSAKKKSGRT